MKLWLRESFYESDRRPIRGADASVLVCPEPLRLAMY